VSDLVCPHGHLSRQCEICEQHNEIYRMAVVMRELMRCLSHERRSFCGRLYDYGPDQEGCKLADSLEAYAAIQAAKEAKP
jgi:hypothetical protein